MSWLRRCGPAPARAAPAGRTKSKKQVPPIREHDVLPGVPAGIDATKEVTVSGNAHYVEQSRTGPVERGNAKNLCQVMLVRTTFVLSAGDGERAAIILPVLLGLRGCGRRSAGASRDEMSTSMKHSTKSGGHHEE